jgi:nucleoside-diphosphate-sugar epimerase
LQRHHNQPGTTIAVLGADTVVGSALCALLGDHGYRINPLDAHPTGVADELLEGADLLLLAPRLDKCASETFLGAMGKGAPQRADVPVIALSTAVEEGLPEKEGVIRVPWPRETKALVERIEAALAGEGTEDAVAI